MRLFPMLRLSRTTFYGATAGTAYAAAQIPGVNPTLDLTLKLAAAVAIAALGHAAIDKGRCLPFAHATPCIVCEETCPTPKKAIWLEEVEAMGPRGERVTLQQPHVDPDLCIGCGICTNKCVIQGDPAVLVSSVGETRNAGNGVLLS